VRNSSSKRGLWVENFKLPADGNQFVNSNTYASCRHLCEPRLWNPACQERRTAVRRGRDGMPALAGPAFPLIGVGRGDR